VEVWVWQGPAAWHFVSLPVELTEGIKALRGPTERGWGSLRVEATVGSVVWRTSIFPDRRSGAFLLPIKAEVRKRAGIGAGDRIALKVELML
jgi:hypothetical protein